MAALFAAIACALAGIAVAAALAERWVIAAAAAVLSTWIASLTATLVRRKRR